MIYFVVKRAYRYCIAALASDFGYPLPPNTALAYEDLFEACHAAPGTYVFGDIERLSDAELNVAADIAKLMSDEPGFQVVNHPARVRTRYGFLRAMREAGLNDFDAYRAEGFPRPRKFPVFVRSEAAHIAPLSALLTNQADLEAALSHLRTTLQPLRGLIVVEYCAEAFAEGIWRRHSTFRIGDVVQFHDIVSERSWNVKYGQRGLVDETTYAEDHEKLLSNFKVGELREAFAIAEIDYGRADFGLIAGRPQVYEINTNPYIRRKRLHESSVRGKSVALAHELLARDFVALSRQNDPTRGIAMPLSGRRIERLRNERREKTDRVV